MTLTGAQGVAEAINFQEAGVGKVAELRIFRCPPGPML